MTTPKLSIYFLEQFIAIFSSIYFFDSTINHKHNIVKKFSLYCVFVFCILFVTLLSTYKLIPPITKSVSIVSLYYILINLLSKNNFKTKLLILFTPFAIQNFLVVLSAISISILFEDTNLLYMLHSYYFEFNYTDTSTLQVIQLSNTIVLPLHIFASLLVNNKNKKNILFLLKLSFIVNFCYTGLVYIIFYLISKLSDASIYLLISTPINLFSYTINFGIFFSVRSFNENNEKIMQYEVNSLKQKFQYKHYEIAKKNNEEATKKYHDIKNQLNIIYIMLDKDKDKAQNILNTINESLSCILPLNFCDNELINIIFSDKIEKINTLNINLSVNLKNLNVLVIPDLDIINIFTNLLDNAINACKKVNKNDRTLEIISRKEKMFFIIQVKNSFNKSYNKHMSKQNGQGLKILKDICNKYNGNLYISKENFEFNIKLLFDCSYFKENIK